MGLFEFFAGMSKSGFQYKADCLLGRLEWYAELDVKESPGYSMDCLGVIGEDSTKGPCKELAVKDMKEFPIPSTLLGVVIYKSIVEDLSYLDDLRSRGFPDDER